MKQVSRAIHGMSESVESINWLQRIGIAGLVFFIGKGLLWIVLAAWIAY